MLRCVFDITVSPREAISFADIRLFNLDKETEITRGDSITFSAGFENALDAIFIGQIVNILKERSGPDVATRLLCRSGTSFQDRGSANASYGAGAKLVDVLRDLARSWPRFLDIQESQFEDAPTFTSGFVADGDIPAVLDALGYQFNFDWLQERGRIVVTRRGYERNTTVFDVNQYTGMRGVPEVTRGPEGLGVTVNVSLNPYIRSNSQINVQSEFSTFNTGNLFIQELAGDASVNGVYNVLSMAYKGDSHGDSWNLEIDGIRAGTAPTPEVSTNTNGKLIWGARVAEDFRVKTRSVAKNLNYDPNWLMAIMAFETGETFSASTRNPRSTAVGLLQFIEPTARGLGTTTARLAAMTAVQQLDFVEAYFRQFGSRIRNLGDAYMAVLWPAAIGKADTYVMWESTGPYQREYNANSGLDVNRDGKITRGEALSRINKSVVKGQQFVR